MKKGTETILAPAPEVTGKERERIIGRQKARFQTFATFEQKLARTIPVFRPERREL